MGRDQLAMDLRSDAERDLARRVDAFRDHMDRDWRRPDRYLQIRERWHEDGRHERRIRHRAQPIIGGGIASWQRIGGWDDHGWTNAVRCLRCGDVIYPYDRVINHDLGWCGCPGDRARKWGGTHGQFKSAADMNRGRVELKVLPRCAACGHAWGLHTHHLDKPPGIGGQSCYTWCGCRRYVAPKGALSPWGTCPGCWAQPDRCVCIR